MENKKNRKMEIRIDEEGYTRIKEMAEKREMNVSEYMRIMSLQQLSIIECPKCKCDMTHKFKDAEERMEAEITKSVLRKLGQELWKV